MKKFLVIIFVIFVAAAALVFGFLRMGERAERRPAPPPFSPTETSAAATENSMGLTVTSPAFVNRGRVPPLYTCDGADMSPPLAFGAVPNGAKSLALVMDDPDAPAGVWVHWVVFNIPPETRVIEAGTEPTGRAGKNSWGRAGYGGPCPPSGVHRYVFTLYALDEELALPEGGGKKELERAMEGRILAQAALVGLYERR